MSRSGHKGEEKLEERKPARHIDIYEGKMTENY